MVNIYYNFLLKSVTMKDRRDLIHKLFHLLFFMLYILLIYFSLRSFLFCNHSWYSWIGLGLAVFGLLFIIYSSYLRKKSSNNGNFSKEGIYSLIRHPEFLGHIIFIWGLLVLGYSFIALFLAIILTVFMIVAIFEEDRKNIKKFGESYKEYVEQIPRVNIIISVFKRLK